MTPATVILAEHLTRRFGAFVAVDGIRVAVQAGEVFGLLGANGAGKTTAIRMLCGLLPPSAGDIRVADVDMARRPRRARQHIGYVPQRFSLYDDLTVLENLKLQAGLYGLRGVHRQRRLQWGLERLALAAQSATPAGVLPLGYKRRLALAAALLHQPPVLFLDEPTSGVDPLVRQQFWELIYELADGGSGILVTTHYMDEAQFCDRLALMQAGRIIVEGAPEELLQRPLRTSLVELRTPDYVACGKLLQQRPEVREITPLAGRLRIRLQPEVAVGEALASLRAAVTAQGFTIQQLQPVAPELEEVFVTVLEEFQEARP